ncbi:MAG TPA: flagellar FliJ family protein [Gemmatimonadales bacterium]|jgi:flagellar export protein FliJ|nr:flagellar FliJ family protein [Gemmatimonadales bacterium]
MTRFRFRLERLLGLREASERARAQAFGRATETAALARRVATASAQLERDAEQQVARAMAVPMPAGLFGSLAAARDDIAGRAADLAEASHVADEERTQALADYRDARRDRSILERLSDIRREAFQLEVSRAERREMDEIAARRPGGVHP